ncbi:hypothetical protein KIS4809_3915 [Bacillus sp. ZZV12-4809]|nr:hypothetical protein KIS4809_3915 [Bacillus sp. ZZV12-4809]
MPSATVRLQQENLIRIDIIIKGVKEGNGEYISVVNKCALHT